MWVESMGRVILQYGLHGNSLTVGNVPTLDLLGKIGLLNSGVMCDKNTEQVGNGQVNVE